MPSFYKVIFLAFLISGCGKFEEFREEDETYITSEDGMIESITGAYNRFQKIFINYQSNGYHWYVTANSKGDDYNHSIINTGYYKLNGDRLDYHCSDTIFAQLYNYYQVSEPWYDIYKTITTLNRIIIHAEKEEGLPREVKKILGEAYFLRGYCYFRLTRTYGEIPLIRDINVSYSVNRESFDEIYNAIEADLQLAIDLLPANKAEARVPFSTPHRGTAMAVLAEVYLSRAGYPLKQYEYYEKAAETAGHILDSASFFGFELLSDFRDLWINQLKWNEEGIFEINFQLNGLGAGVICMTDTSRNRFQCMFLKRGPAYGAAIKFYNNYPESYRKSSTFCSFFARPTDNFDLDIVVPVIPDSMDLCTPVYYQKFNEIWDLNSLDQFNIQSQEDMWAIRDLSLDFNLYIFRYAQTLLTYAEAKARAGQIDDKAIEAVNMVRRRAHKVDLYSPSVYDLLPGLTPDRFLDSVLWERAWELCVEPEGRWFDLVRLEMVEDLKSLRDENDMLDYPLEITKDYYFCPIPDDEMLMNPGLQGND